MVSISFTRASSSASSPARAETMTQPRDDEVIRRDDEHRLAAGARHVVRALRDTPSTQFQQKREIPHALRKYDS